MFSAVEKLLFEVLARTAPKDMGNRTIALCYHKIVPRGHDPSDVDRFTVYMDDFDRQIQAIKEAGFKIINPDQMKNFRGRGVMITFDDNIPTHVTNALAVLQKHRVTATFFLNPNELGDDGRLSEADVEKLKVAGMVIGAHHIKDEVVCDMDYQAFSQAVETCIDFLQRHEMNKFWAYPGGYRGSFTEAQDKLLGRLGFVRFTTYEGDCEPSQLQRLQSRYVLRSNSTMSYFQAILDGRMRILAKIKKGRHALASRLAMGVRR